MRYLVIGGGISGLTAAWELAQHVPGEDIVVLDAADRPGGKLRGATVAGVAVDVGAESVLARRPEALDLIDQVGLGERLVHPSGASAAIWSRGELRPIPRRQLLGVPADPADLAGLLTPGEIERVRAEVPQPVGSADVAVGELVASRLGDAVVDRLVEPLLGGVYAGHARLISAAAAAPALLAAAHAGEPLVAAAARALPPPAVAGPTPARPPVFAGIEGGLHVLPATLAERLRERGVTLRSDTIVRELHRTDTGWTAVSGPVPAPVRHEADRVVLALPPAPATRLLREVAPLASTALGAVETASMAVLTFAFAADGLPELDGSGFLVPPRDDRFIKAATFSASKWDWVRSHGVAAGPAGEDVILLRASVGRHREEASLQHRDPVLIERALADLTVAIGTPLPRPAAHHVQRWGGGLPQYAPGHLDLVATVRGAVAEVPGLAVAGAAYDGVGIPACIASGREAATQVLAN